MAKCTWISNESFYTLKRLDTTGYATEPQAVPEWPHGKAGDCKAQMGHGVQGIPGVYGQLHERTGVATITNSCRYNWTIVYVLKVIIFRIQIANTEEYIDGQLAGNLGEVLIR